VNPLTAAGWTIRVTGIALVVLGLLLWVDAAAGLRTIHMLLGLVLVVALVAAAALALRTGAKPILPGMAIAWAILTLAFGMTQAQILPGDGHVVVEVAHLLVGIVAIGLGEMLVASGRRGARATA
jgi:uncharacterized membrane protein HdeD (DUF308 family)